ncbi:MAG: hypothetical protein NZ849_02360, partial [Meiothermus sp.]
DEERLLDLRSRLDEHAGSLPVQLKVRGPGGWALVEAREVRASEEAVSALGGLDWLSARLVPDREALMRLEGNGTSGADQGPVVPF